MSKLLVDEISDADNTGPVTVTDGAVVNRTGDGTIIDLQAGGTTVGSIGVAAGNNLTFGATASGHAGIYLNDDGILPMSANTVTDNSVDFGSSAYRYKNLYLSGGVYLGGTGAANHLSDYEFGTCTLTLTGSTGAPNTAQTTTGKYTKVGNTVTVTATFANRDVTGATGSVQVTGLPFTSTSEIHLGHFANSRGQTNQYAGYLSASSTNLAQVNYSGSSQAWASTGSGTYAFLTITYMTA
jgi:hypothetical protein